ncbi:MAG: glucose-6-phosphate isomerase [Micrococcaceae bacterium]
MVDIALGKITQDAFDQHGQDLVDNKIASRQAAGDATIWGSKAESEASIRLGWVDLGTTSQELVKPILTKRDELKKMGINHIVLCGMGGSSLAPEVITETDKVELTILDTTDPTQIQMAISDRLDTTAVVVSSKSGSTLETTSQKSLYEKLFKDAGIDATERIIVVTDPGSDLEKSAKKDGYTIFQANPNVGGRYSALTAFGLVPAGLAGADIQQLLDDAKEVEAIVKEDSLDNPALKLACAIGGTKPFRDKTVLVEDGTDIIGYGNWTEQLLAESTGKDGTGILPVVVNKGDFEDTHELDDTVVARIQKTINDSNLKENEFAVAGTLGGQMALWEAATAIAGYLIGINPFDQPDVEAAKVAARELLNADPSKVIKPEPVLSDDAIEVYADSNAAKLIKDSDTVQHAVFTLLGSVDKKEGYIALQAYLNRLEYPELSQMRAIVPEHVERPVTFGWGPRFLHSTGQYHKGGAPVGVFLQITTEYTKAEDIAIPGLDFTFGEVIVAQAGGDANVLDKLGRPVLTLHLKDTKAGIAEIKKIFGIKGK